MQQQASLHSWEGKKLTARTLLKGEVFVSVILPVEWDSAAYRPRLAKRAPTGTGCSKWDNVRRVKTKGGVRIDMGPSPHWQGCTWRASGLEADCNQELTKRNSSTISPLRAPLAA